MDRQRLDKFLWHARVVKARTSAAQLVEKGHVRINGVRETTPGHAVKPGDVLTVALDRNVRVLKVIGFSERRGDASSAPACSMRICSRGKNSYLKQARIPGIASLAAPHVLR